MKTHELKILPEYFHEVEMNRKTFELRYNDRDYQIGDKLILKEFDGKEYSGKELERTISYIFEGTGQYGLTSGWVVLALKKSPPAILD